MKRIELNTGVAERGYWDGEKFEYKMRLQVASYDYEFSVEEYFAQFDLAKAFIESSGGSPDAVQIYDIASGREVFLYAKEDVEEILKNSDKEEFLIYLETNTDTLFICTGGIRARAIPKKDFPITGDYKIFTKANLKNGYLSAIHDFETIYEPKGAIKLHILPKK